MATPKEGDTFQHVRRCEKYSPLYYAAASGDLNPIHTDPNVARMVGFSDVILHGMCSFAWAAEAASRFLGDPGAIKKVHARFTRPVAIGDEITFDGKVVAVEGKRIKLELDARNQRREAVLRGVEIEAELA